MNKPAVLCYGEIGVDNLIQAEQLPSPEVAVFPSSDSYHIGGAAANTAVWLSELGVSTSLSGNAIGTDLYGGWLWEWLSKHPLLDLTYVEKRSDVTTPFTRAIVTPDGERSFLIFHYPQTPKTVLRGEMARGTQFVALDLYGGPERLAAAKLAVETGSRTAIGDVIHPDHPVLPYASIITNSSSYIRDVFPGIDVMSHSLKLQSISKGIVITTDGPRPIHVVDQDGRSFSIHPPKVNVVDATGAGDAFRAGLLYGLTSKMPLEKAACCGAACGSLKVQTLGAASHLPSVQEVRQLAETLEPRIT